MCEAGNGRLLFMWYRFGRCSAVGEAKGEVWSFGRSLGGAGSVAALYENESHVLAEHGHDLQGATVEQTVCRQ
jgi:hypothetical protein